MTNISVASRGNLMSAAWDFALHQLCTDYDRWILVLVARQRGLFVATVERDRDFVNGSSTEQVALVSAGLLTPMRTSVLEARAGLHTVDSMMQHVAMTFGNTRVSAV